MGVCGYVARSVESLLWMERRKELNGEAKMESFR